MAAYPVFVLYYLIMCLLVAMCAINRRPGFLVTLMLSLLITPFLSLLLLYITKPKHKKCPHC